jgi:NADPH2:quinone reductase
MVRHIQADRFGDASVLRIAESVVPEPAAGQVRLRVHAAGVNPADAYILSGSYAFYKPSIPFTPGFDAAGTVDAIGADVTDLKIGDRVFAAPLGLRHSGSYAELMTCDAVGVHPLPAHLSFDQGAAVGVPYLTAYRALFQRGGLSAGETVLIHGASGGVGIPCVQLASGSGVTVIGTAGSEAGRLLVAQQGAHHVLDHTKPGYLDEVAAITGGRGVQLIVEMAADQNLESDFVALAKHGRIVVVGSRAPINFTPRLAMIAEADIRGTALWNMSEVEVSQATNAVAEHLAHGSAVPVVARGFPLERAADAVNALMSSRARGKLILDCSP